VRVGAEYEQFVYDKLHRLSRDAVVTLNDNILGKEGGVTREVDASVSLSAAGEELL